MAIVDSIGDTKRILRASFDKARSAGKISQVVPFEPVARLKDETTNLYEMFCLSPLGRRLRSVAGYEFRPTITSSTSLKIVHWSKKHHRYVVV